MKESGVNHIGQIPDEWGLVKVKHLFNIGRGRVISELELNPDGIYPVYSSQTKDDGCMGYIDTFDYSIPQLTWTTDGVYAGTVFYREGKYNCTNICGTLSPKPKLKFDLKFLKHTLEFIAVYHKRPDTNGAKIMNNEMANIKVPLPTLNEQVLIASYLDKKCSNIDSIISDLEKQIEILEKYRKSVITETVTKGLNPDVEMRDSGIEWIGLIPDSWKVIRLKYLGTARNGLTYSPDDVSDSGTLVLRSSNIQNNKLSFDDNVYVNMNIPNILRTRENDILICSRNGSRHLIGKNVLIDKTTTGETYGAFMCVFRGKWNRYLSYILNSSIFEHYLGTFLTSTINQLTNSNLNNIKVPFTFDIYEQNEIIKYLDKKCSEIDSIIEDKKNQIDTIKKYKNSLIYEYVTGKKRVSQGDVNE